MVVPDGHVLFIRCQEHVLRNFSDRKSVVITRKVENRWGKDSD